MKHLILCVILFFLSHTIFAQQSCSPLEARATIFFGNGINTTSESAAVSRRKLQEELGSSYNGIALSYGVAYNQTDGIILDLAQSLLQAQIQWSSQIMGWMNNLGAAPDWYNTLFQKSAQDASKLVAPELDGQVLQYHDELLRGHSVLVVSHSQGNLYVNEAKILLKQISTAEQMGAFGIFGVATPANNVGGAGNPYYTNHRDFISHILPDALPANWTLHHLEGGIADDISPLVAHYFNDTYMSNDLDIKTALVKGIKTQLASLQRLTPACSNYRKSFLNQLQGEFTAQEVSTREFASISIDEKGSFNFPNEIATFTSPNDTIAISRNFVGSGASSLDKDIHFDGNDHAVVGNWDFSGQFVNIRTASNNYQKTDNVPVSALLGPVNLIGAAIDMMRDYRGAFPPGTCKTYADAKNSPTAYTVNEKYLPIAVSGTTVTVGGQAYDLNAGLSQENMAILAVNKKYPLDYEPQFFISASFVDGSGVAFTYKQFKGLISFLVMSPPKMLSCSADWY